MADLPAATWKELLTAWKDLAALIIAVIALIQPWALRLWRWLLRPGAIDIHETGAVEVGYSSLGPTLGLQGTLRGRHRELFVSRIAVEVVRQDDQSRHDFDWFVFRSIPVLIGRDMPLALPGGFMLMTTQPHRYNILFNDAALQTRMSTVLEPLRPAWFAALTAAIPTPPTDPQAIPQQLSQAAQTAYAVFRNSKEHVGTYTQLDRLFYWTAGLYKLTLAVHVTRPNHTFAHTWSFQLSQQQSDVLRPNSIRIVGEVCGQQPLGQFQFVYSRYEAS